MIKKHKVVKLDYTVRDDNGEIVDTTLEDEPLEYMHGAEQLIEGLEKALEGKQVSDRFLVRIEPENAYGFHNEELVQVVDISTFEDMEPDEIEPGMVFDASTDHGEIQVTIVDVDGNNITIDGNHPLAGLSLTFDGEVLEVRDASPEEIKQAFG